MVHHIHRTAVFTIHNPTNRTKQILDQAFAHYTFAYTNVLHHFRETSVEALRMMATYAHADNGEPLTNTRQLVKNLFCENVPSITAALAPLESSLRESLKVHVAETLLSYIELSLSSKQTPSYPQRLRLQDQEPQRLASLEGLQTIGDDREEENKLFALLQQTRQSPVVSIPFTRVDPERNCGLFYNPETQQFYARLFVVSPKSHHGKPLAIAGQYVDVRSGSIYKRKEDATDSCSSFGAGKGSIMVPLEMGRWHEDPLRFADRSFLAQRQGKGMPSAQPVSAKLVKKEKSYQVHVAFRFPKPERVTAEAYIGVDRGITCLTAGAVVSLDGKQVLETFQGDGLQLRALQKQMEANMKQRQAKGKLTKGDRRRGRVADQHAHLCANQIVELAIKYKAQVVMEDLSSFAAPHKREKGKRRSNFNAMLPRRQYQKIETLVNTKLELVGLPKVRTVSAFFTSQTCSNCGHISKESRSVEDRTLFCCVECHHQAHADEQAGINIARKIHWLALRGKEKQQNLPDDQKTTWAGFIKEFCKK